MTERLTVRELVAVLESVDQNLPVELEGCDCTGACIGASLYFGPLEFCDDDKRALLLRRKYGVAEHDKLELIA